MADISLSWTLTTENKNRVINGLAMQNGYQELVMDNQTNTLVPNPKSKAVFCKDVVKNKIMTDVGTWETNRAIAEAREAKRVEISNIGIE
jgi:hypothetical protein